MSESRQRHSSPARRIILIMGAKPRPQHLDQSAEHRIARGGPERVVDHQETVDVTEGDDESRSVALRPVDLAAETARAGTAAQHPGQVVPLRLCSVRGSRRSVRDSSRSVCTRSGLPALQDQLRVCAGGQLASRGSLTLLRASRASATCSRAWAATSRSPPSSISPIVASGPASPRGDTGGWGGTRERRPQGSRQPGSVNCPGRERSSVGRAPQRSGRTSD